MRIKIISMMRNTPFLNLTIMGCIAVVFLLLHTNQRSSQSAATILLLFAPLCIFLIKDSQVFKHKALITTISLVVLFSVFNFLILTQHEFNKLALSSYRALFFWLLFPIVSVLIWKVKPSKELVFILFALAAIISLSVIIKDSMSGQRRGFSSGHPIFWGNISLCTGLISFALRKSIPDKSWADILGFIALTCGLIASFWSQTRGGWISIPISLLLLIAFRSITKTKAIFGVLIIFITVFSSDSLKNRMTYTFQNSNVFSEQLQLGSSTQQRLDMWSAASDIFIENPFLGSGFSYYSNRVLELIKEGKHPKWIASHERPHNEYLNTLVNGGLVGLLLLCSIIISMLYIFHNLTKNTAIRLSGYLLISQFLIFSISEVFLSTKVTIVYFCIASALMIFLGLNEKENEKC